MPRKGYYRRGAPTRMICANEGSREAGDELRTPDQDDLLDQRSVGAIGSGRRKGLRPARIQVFTAVTSGEMAKGGTSPSVGRILARPDDPGAPRAAPIASRGTRPPVTLP